MSQVTRDIEFLKWRVQGLQHDVAHLTERITVCRRLRNPNADAQEREIEMYTGWKDQAERLLADRKRELDEASDER